MSIFLYRSLKVNEDVKFVEVNEVNDGFLIDRRDRPIRQHGLRYLTWFMGHGFSWLTVSLGIAILLVHIFGLRPFPLAISAGLLTCGICSLSGLIFFAKRPLLLGICWQEIEWSQVTNWWESVSVTLFLRERHKKIVAQELQKPNSTYRKIIAILDSEPVPSESVGSKVELWEQGSFSHNWWREQWQRVHVLFIPFLSTLLLALPLFIFLRPSISDTTVILAQQYKTPATSEDNVDNQVSDNFDITNSSRTPEEMTEAAGEDAATPGNTDPAGGQPPPDPSTGDAPATPGTTNPTGGQSTPDPVAEGAATPGNTDPAGGQSTPDPSTEEAADDSASSNNPLSQGTVDPESSEDDGPGSGIDDSGDLSATPGVEETFFNEPPIPSGSEQRIELELPPLQMNSGLGNEDNPEATAVPSETAVFPPDFQPFPQLPGTLPLPIQRTPNWIRILFIN